VLPGDFLGGSRFATNCEGEGVIDVLNHIGLDYVTLGNHEFDFGSPRTEQLMDMSTFPYLGSNVRYSDNNAIFHTTKDFDTFHVIAQDKYALKVGVFGVCTQSTPNLSHPTDAVTFEDVITHSKRLAHTLKHNEKCDIIIALTHVHLELDKKIAGIGNIDAVIGGHDHDPYALVHHDTAIMKTGQDINYLGILDLDIEVEIPEENVLEIVSNGGDNYQCIQCQYPITVHKSLQLLSTRNYLHMSDSCVDAIISKWNHKMQSQSNVQSDHAEEVVQIAASGSLSTLSADLRSHETAFACWVADAMKNAYIDEGCDVGIINGGFIRGNMIYPSGFTLLKYHFLEEMPFQRTNKLIAVTGKDIRLGLEQMISSSPHPVGSFPHLSEGFHVTYDLSKPSLERIIDIEINGEKLVIDKIYKLAISEFYVEKEADNVSAFNREIIGDQHETICDCAIRYFKTLSEIKTIAPNRFVRLDHNC
jgi:2',3'-cyclic-nucleotide 2'-phosphodiesterase (5'-nucleotidase family)